MCTISDKPINQLWFIGLSRLLMFNKKYFKRENLMKGWLTMTKGKQRQSLRGAVLIMVLTVMVVLIIMLMATLTVVTTAGQRIYTKFEENQAYYTARSALDVFTENLLGDSAYYAYEDGSNKRKFEYSVQKDDSTWEVKDDKFYKQGLALQLDLYKIKSSNEDGVDLSWAENPVLADGTFRATSPEETIYTLDNATGLPYIEYDITFPAAASNSSGSYGKIVDIDKNDDDKDGEYNDQIARIKVEVLDRKFHTSVEYTEAQILGAIANPSGNPSATPPIPSKADVQKAIAEGNRSKDYMKIKITSTIQMMDTEGVAIVILETKELVPPSCDNALTTTGSFSGGSGAQVGIAGGVSTMNFGTSIAGDGNSVSGSLFTVGKLEWTSSAKTVLNKKEMVVAMDGVANSSNPTIVKTTVEGTFAFFGGESTLNNGGLFGYDDDAGNIPSSYKVPVIADKIVKTSATDMKINGDLYVNTFDYQINNPGKVKVTGISYVKNLIIPNDPAFVTYSGGITKINLGAIASDMHLKLCKDYTITVTGDPIIYTKNNFPAMWEENTAADNPGDLATLYTAPSVDGFDINTYSVEKIMIDEENNDYRIYRKYDLPFQVNGQTFVTIPTAQAYFVDYYMPHAFDDATGDMVKHSSYVNPGPDPDTAYSVIYSDGNKDMWKVDATALLQQYIASAKEESEPLPAFTQIADLTVGTTFTYGQKDYTVEALPSGGDIDLSSGDKFYVASGNYDFKHWTVKGTSGTMFILVPENATVSFNGSTIQTEYIKTTTTSIVDGTTKAPKVFFYAGTNANITTANNCFFAAYFMMPTAKIYLNNGTSNMQYTNKTGVTTNVSNVGVVGSILCDEFTESNKTAIIFLSSDSGDVTPGEPHLSVTAAQYVRK